MIARRPPVGQPVLWRTDVAPPVFDGYRSLWLNSGTAALALALMAALAVCPGRKRVILPGYGCPDLVAAAVFAGAQAVLVDCAADDPGYDLGALAAACEDGVAAIVAVNFLGIRERMAELADIARSADCVLIEDCAQWYPEPADGPADAMLTSFGRGKPVNLLGGGALLLREDGALGDWQPPALAPMAPLGRVKALVFNQLLRPTAYGLVSRVPGTAIGTTVYHALSEIQALDAVRLSLLGANVQRHGARDRASEYALGGIVAREAAGVEALAPSLASRWGRLLRYPLLCPDQATRDGLVSRWTARGASAFYARALPEIPGVAAVLPVMAPVPNARRFAARLLTLPVG